MWSGIVFFAMQRGVQQSTVLAGRENGERAREKAMRYGPRWAPFVADLQLKLQRGELDRSANLSVLFVESIGAEATIDPAIELVDGAVEIEGELSEMLRKRVSFA